MWNCAKNKITNNTGGDLSIIFIRHAITKGNTLGKYIGSTDEDIEPCKMDKEIFDDTDADMVFLSPMKRCLSTASIMFPCDINDFICIDEFREINFGVFEGKTHKELDGDKHYQQWIDSGATIKIKGGESKSEFIKRTMKGFDRMLSVIERCNVKENTRENVCNVYAVVHGGTIMSIMSSLFDGDYYDYKVSNLSGVRLLINQDGSYKGGFL